MKITQRQGNLYLFIFILGSFFPANIIQWQVETRVKKFFKYFSSTTMV